jgi:hypothetical protein
MRTVLATAATLCLALHLGSVHRWFSVPYSLWAGWDEAYITVFAQRMLDGRWLPYVDAVSHRGPMLYWLAAILQWFAGGYSWAAMRFGALLAAQLTLWLAFLIGVAFRKPLAGFLASASFVFSTVYAMEPKDGIGFNGELVAMPFVLLGALITTWALQTPGPRRESQLWFAALSGLLISLGGLCKQPTFLHILPVGLWWIVDGMAHRDKPFAKGHPFQPAMAFAIGAVTPVLAVTAYFARSNAFRPFSYYLFTYNRSVYMEPVTAGYAVESTFLFWREHGALLLVILSTIAWALARFFSKLEPSHHRWSTAFSSTALPTTTALHTMLALAGAIGTFRFWDHYFIPVLPWLGLLLGTMLEDSIERIRFQRPLRSNLVVLACFVGISFVFRLLTTLWLDGQRRAGEFYGNPEEEPIARYVQAHSQPSESIFVWGFAPEIYVNSKRRAASRFVFTTFPAGIVPWFHWLSFEHEERLVVPGSRELLLRELESEKPALVVDVPNSIHGRGIRRYPPLVSYLDQKYCFVETIVGRNGRTAHIYHRRGNAQTCQRLPPPNPSF